MNSTIFFSVCSLFYCILLMVVVFSKKLKNTTENRILKVLIVSNAIGLLLEVSGMFLGSNYEKYELLNSIVLRIMLVYYVLWASVFVLFVINISKQKEKKEKNNRSYYFLMFIPLILVLTLPLIYNVNDGVIVYTSGPAVETVYAYSMICEIVCLIVMFSNIKKIKATNYVSLFALVSLGTLVFTIQSSRPDLLLSTTMQTFVTYIVYFTINKNEVVKNNIKRIEK